MAKKTKKKNTSRGIVVSLVVLLATFLARKVIELSPGQKSNPYRAKAGGMSVGRRTLLTSKSEMIEL